MNASKLALPASFLALVAGVALAGCSSSDAGTTPGGTGGSSAIGGSGGGGTGGTGGSSTGGTSGSSTGGTGGSSTGGTAGSSTGGTAGSSTGGSAGSSTGGTGGGPVSCVEISPTGVAFDSNNGSFSVWAGSTDPNIDDNALPDYFSLEFHADDTGTFDLAAAPNDNYEGCTQCVRVLADVSGFSVGKQYFQSGGTLEIDAATPPVTGAAVKGKLTNVTLVEGEVDSTTFVWTPVVGGQCLHIASADLNIGCGNGVADGFEVCDGADLNGKSCTGLGFTGGAATCTATCGLDLSGCTGWTCNATDLGAFIPGTTITKSGDTCTGSEVYNVPATGCVGTATPGKEQVYALSVPAGAKAEVLVDHSGFKAASWATADCNDLSGAACVTGSTTSVLDRFTLDNTAATATTYYVVVDGLTVGGNLSTPPCGSYKIRVRDPQSVPPAWTCDAAQYANLDLCDCNCGAWDPDCDEPNTPTLDCAFNETCVYPGVCQ